MMMRCRRRYDLFIHCNTLSHSISESTVVEYPPQRPSRRPLLRYPSLISSSVSSTTPFQYSNTNHPSLKKYCVNGHTMTNNRSGCVGVTSPLPSILQPSSLTHTTSATSTKSHMMITDLPKNMGGTNTAPQPIELLLMSFIGCTQATAYFVSRQIQIIMTPESKEVLSSSRSYELQHMKFENITTSRDIRSSIQNVPIQIQSCGTNDESDITNVNINPIPLHIQDISGTIIVYFGINHKNSDKHHHHRQCRNQCTNATEISNASDNNDGIHPDVHNNNSSSAQLPNRESERRALYLRTLQDQTEQRCPIANMIHSSGCSINITWKDGGDYESHQPLS